MPCSLNASRFARSRRGAWRLPVLAAMAFCLSAVGYSEANEGQSDAAAPPMTGEATESMRVYDRLIAGWMKKWNIPGGQVAVAKEGRLVLARGYGWADVEGRKPVQPDTRFRVASVSKPITAAAVLRLVEQKRLALDARVFEMLREFPLAEDAKVDPRLREITVRQLLAHSAGWDRERSGDPMFKPFETAAALKAPAPAEPATIIRYMLRQPLDFNPGEKFVYSNFGYCVLGRLIEQETGKGYEHAVRELVLEPCGATRLELGRTRLSQRADDEARYYAQPAERRTRCVLADVAEEVSWPDGGFYLEALDAHGGWIGSAPDLLRFVTALDGSRGLRLLQSETLEMMTARPEMSVAQTGDAYYAFGWMIHCKGEARGWRQATWWHTGSLPGASALLVRTNRGIAWTALFNSRPPDEQIKTAAAELDSLLWQAAGEIKQWPEHDLF